MTDLEEQMADVLEQRELAIEWMDFEGAVKLNSRVKELQKQMEAED